MPLNTTKVKRKRERLGMTLEEAARTAGLGSRQAWHVVESGKQSPRLTTLERMAKALRVRARDLLD